MFQVMVVLPPRNQSSRMKLQRTKVNFPSKFTLGQRAVTPVGTPVSSPTNPCGNPFPQRTVPPQLQRQPLSHHLPIHILSYKTCQKPLFHSHHLCQLGLQNIMVFLCYWILHLKCKPPFQLVIRNSFLPSPDHGSTHQCLFGWSARHEWHASRHRHLPVVARSP